jgi:hypothetical protein
MGPPSSFFLAAVAIVILAFAILGFVSAVNYKNVSNNTTEGESIDKGTAGSLSTVMIILGLVMIIVFIWIVYVIFTYNNKDKSGIDPRNASLLAKAKESIYKLDSVKTSYKTLQDNFNKYKDKSVLKNKEFEKWNYCPSPRIKINIKKETGKVINPEYDGQGNIIGLIVKPEKDSNGCDYKKIDLEMQTQDCYILKQEDESSGPGGFFSGFKQKLGNMTQTMNPMYPSMPNVVNRSYQLTNPNTNSKDCDAKGFFSRKEINMPIVSFKSGCGNNSSSSKSSSIPGMYPGPLVNPSMIQPTLNPNL